ncbi:MAG: EAL domain-containing protein [Rhodoferax sp.]|nr:EAL domain-containing protein [Rhodoferax sp.]MDP3653183.1 EAL domain-containing protein [Rhodoferax sp.]
MKEDLTTPSASENPWKLALEGSGAGVWDWNLATGAQTHSRQWEEMLGFEAGELRRGHIEFISRVHPDDLAPLNTAVTGYLNGSLPSYAVDLRLRCKDGSWTWIQSRGMIVSRSPDGTPLRMIGTHTDISERKRSEAALRELNTRLCENAKLLETTLTSISQGILVSDATGRLSAFNPRVCELLDLPMDLLKSHPMLNALAEYQNQRGDFGPQECLVDAHARSQIRARNDFGLPRHYLRQTREGRTLEVKTQHLPSGGLVRTFADVSDYFQLEAARQRLDQLLEATQSIARVGGWEADVVNDRVFWTTGVYRMLETSEQEYTPTTIASANRFLAPASVALIKAAYVDAVDQPQSHDLELQMVTAKGRPIWVHSIGSAIWEQGRVVKRTSVLQDITERKQTEAALRASEERWKLALESSGDGVWDWYIQTGAEFFSQRLLQMCGYEGTDLLSRPEEFDDRTHPDDLDLLQQARLDHFEGRTPTYQSERRIRCKDGSWKWVLSRGMVISRDAQGQPLRMIGTFTDISNRKESEALIKQQAFFDALTGLPNRRMLHDRLEQEIKKSKRDTQQLAILFIDLDHFKEVNDTLGHGCGDMLLVEAARRLRACVRESDTVARMGGDEFTIILTELPDASHLEGILQKILRSIEEVFQLGTEQVFISASIGITMYPLDATEIESLFRNADQALYVAKDAGRNRFSFFTPSLQEAAQTRVRLANDLRSALIEQQFKVVYQPIVELATGTIRKAEALLRWYHPVRGLVSPAAFIPIAEASGLIVDIGEWVFHQATHQVQAWRARLDPQFQISINRSPVQFQHDGDGRAPWAMQLQAKGLPGESIVVEITEGLLLDTNTSVGNQLLELRNAGMQVSLDDFGTGYSSLSYLQKFDIDYIKIDQTFVRNLVAGSTDLALCQAIIVMAHALGIKVVAEGVETTQHRDLLAAAGCDFAQGYLFARPMPAADFEAFMANYDSNFRSMGE